MLLRIVDAFGQIHTASASDNSDLFAASRVSAGALGIITSVTLQTVPLWKMKKTSFDYSLSKLLVDLPELLEEYERLQWSWIPYTDNATVVIREDVEWEAPIEPSGSDGGCWSESQPTDPSCTDVSYKTLTDSKRHYEQRSLYTEMEMFIPVENSIDAVRDFIAFMDTVRPLHDESVTLSAMLRYVKADEIMISPMEGRDTAVMSIIVLGGRDSTADQTEFKLFAGGLQSLTEAKYNGRPHWGKVNYPVLAPAGGSYADYLAGAYPRWGDFHALLGKMDPSGLFSNAYLKERGLTAMSTA